MQKADIFLNLGELYVGEISILLHLENTAVLSSHFNCWTFITLNYLSCFTDLSDNGMMYRSFICRFRCLLDNSSGFLVSSLIQMRIRTAQCSYIYINNCLLLWSNLTATKDYESMTTTKNCRFSDSPHVCIFPISIYSRMRFIRHPRGTKKWRICRMTNKLKLGLFFTFGPRCSNDNKRNAL